MIVFLDQWANQFWEFYSTLVIKTNQNTKDQDCGDDGSSSLSLRADHLILGFNRIKNKLSKLPINAETKRRFCTRVRV